VATGGVLASLITVEHARDAVFVLVAVLTGVILVAAGIGRRRVNDD
jgi:hypothetical protein